MKKVEFEVTLSPGETKEISVPVVLTKVGKHRVKKDDTPGSGCTFEVISQPKADIQITSLSAPQYNSVGQLAIRATVTNKGNIEGTKTIELTLLEGNNEVQLDQAGG